MNPMVALDTHYGARAATAAVLFQDWGQAVPSDTQVTHCSEVGEYRSGSFFLRELPSLRQALESLRPSLVVVDGYVHLGEADGLGAHLHRALGGSIPVVGVAKNPFVSAPGVAVCRGQSARPLFVTALGVDEGEAAEWVRGMHGAYRIPTLLALADRLARDAVAG